MDQVSVTALKYTGLVYLQKCKQSFVQSALPLSFIKMWTSVDRMCADQISTVRIPEVATSALIFVQMEWPRQKMEPALVSVGLFQWLRPIYHQQIR
jgi:hypothetical protein